MVTSRRQANMVNDGSRPTKLKIEDKSTSIPRLAKKYLVAPWRERHFSTQFCVVARHDQRADALSAGTVNGEYWSLTEDSVKYPVDPPLSDAGILGAQATAATLRATLEENTQMHVIACSPYYRCVQTAV